MEYLVLEDDLLEEFYKFQLNLNFNHHKIKKILNFYKNHISNVAQMQRIGRNLNINFQRTISQLSRKRLNRCNLIDLSKKTKLKNSLSYQIKKSPFSHI